MCRDKYGNMLGPGTLLSLHLWRLQVEEGKMAPVKGEHVTDAVFRTKLSSQETFCLIWDNATLSEDIRTSHVRAEPDLRHKNEVQGSLHRDPWHNCGATKIGGYGTVYKEWSQEPVVLDCYEMEKVWKHQDFLLVFAGLFSRWGGSKRYMTGCWAGQCLMSLRPRGKNSLVWGDKNWTVRAERQTLSGRHEELLITRLMPSLQWSVVVAASRAAEASPQQGHGDGDGPAGKPSPGCTPPETLSTTIARSIRAKTMLEGHPRLQPKPRLKPHSTSVERPQDGGLDAAHPIGGSLRGSAKKKGINRSRPVVQSLWRLYGRRLGAVIAAKGLRQCAEGKGLESVERLSSAKAQQRLYQIILTDISSLKWFMN